MLQSNVAYTLHHPADMMAHWFRVHLELGLLLVVPVLSTIQYCNLAFYFPFGIKLIKSNGNWIVYLYYTTNIYRCQEKALR